MAAFDKRLEAVQTSKSLKAAEREAQVQQIEKERDNFREEGRLPASQRMKADAAKYRSSLKSAMNRFGQESDAVAKAYRAKGDAASASDVIAEAERMSLETADLEAFPDRWIPLFNGRDLNGWNIQKGERANWDVQAGALVAKGNANSPTVGFLVTKREFRDYILRFEYQLAPNSDSGFEFRAPPSEPSHLEFRLRSFRETPSTHGFLSWSLSGNARQGAPPAPMEPDKVPWNQALIEMRGDFLLVSINGQLVQSTDLRWFADHPDAIPGLKSRSGQIGFKVHQGTAQYRNIAIRGISRGASTTGTGRLPDPRNASTPITGRYYWIINEKTGKALDINVSSLVPGAPVIQVDAAERPSQGWTLRPRRERLQIVNGNSNLLINIPYGIENDGRGLIQHPDGNGAKNELWTLVPQGPAFKILSDQGLGIIVDAEGRVKLWTLQGQPNELWRFVPAGQ